MCIYTEKGGRGKNGEQAGKKVAKKAEGDAEEKN